MKPPAPGPVSGLSATQDTQAAATHASTALPPASSTCAPASAVHGCPAATAPVMGSVYGGSLSAPAPETTSRRASVGRSHAERSGVRGVPVARPPCRDVVVPRAPDELEVPGRLQIAQEARRLQLRR